MVGFELERTLSPHGPVARALCRQSDEGFLLGLEEHTAVSEGRSLVSMNLWGFRRSVPRRAPGAIRGLRRRGRVPAADRGGCAHRPGRSPRARAPDGRPLAGRDVAGRPPLGGRRAVSRRSRLGGRVTADLAAVVPGVRDRGRVRALRTLGLGTHPRHLARDDDRGAATSSSASTTTCSPIPVGGDRNHPARDRARSIEARGRGADQVDRRVLTLVPARDGALCRRDGEGRWWRMFLFVDGARSHDVATSPR